MRAVMAKRKPTKAPDPWAGIEPANRPTPERLRHGSIRVVDFKENGQGRVKGRVAIDFESTPIRAAHDKGKLSDRQRDAAERLLWLWHKVNEVPGGRRDTLDMTPRGSNEMSADAIAWLIDRKTEYKLALAFLTPEQEMVVRGVCIHEEPIGPRSLRRLRFRHLDEGLDVLADVWGMAGKGDWPGVQDYAQSCRKCGSHFAGPKRAPHCWRCAPLWFRIEWQECAR